MPFRYDKNAQREYFAERRKAHCNIENHALGWFFVGAYLLLLARKRQVQHPGLVREDDSGHPVG